jgi:hypothetical protein
MFGAGDVFSSVAVSFEQRYAFAGAYELRLRREQGRS